MLLTTGERVVGGAADDGARRSSASTRSASPAARSASSPTPSHRKAKIVEVKGDRVREALAEGKVVRDRRVPGRQHRQGDHHDGSWRLRPHRVGARPGAGRRRLRDLHRRHRRVHRRPAHRAAGPQARRRSTSTRCSRWPAPARKVLALRSRRVRPQPRRPPPRPLRFTWEPGTWVTDRGAQHGRPDHLRRRHRHERGEGHRARRARPAGHLGRAVRAARRRPTSTST